MKVTINIPDVMIKNAVENMLEGNLYENYDSDVRDLAGVPKKAALIKTVIADEKFMAALAKELTARFDPEDYLYDIVWDIPCKTVSDLVRKCDMAFEQEDAAAAEKAAAEIKAQKEADEAAAIARTIAALKKAGYTITKA